MTGLWRRVRLPERSARRGRSRTGFGGLKRWCLVVLCSGCLSPVTTLAGQLGYAAGTYLSYESNIDRIETNPRPELIASVFGGLSYQENTAEVTARATAYLEHRHFTKHTFSDDNRGYLQATGTWTIMPRRLLWIVDDTFQDVGINLLTPATPANRTNSNSFNTGPDLTYPLSSSNAAVVGARYGRLDIQNSLADNQRYLGYVRGVHTMPSLSKISLNLEESRIYFEPGNTFSRASRQDVFARFETLSSGEGLYAGDGAKLDLGKSHVVQYTADPSTPPNDLDGHLVRLALSKAISSQFTLRMSYSDQISDTYSDLIAGIAGSSGSLAPTDGSVFLVTTSGLATADVYHSKRVDVGFASHGGSIEYTLLPYARSVDFQTLDQDYNEIGTLFFWRWISGPRRFDVFANFSKRKYDILERTDADRNYGASVEFKLNRTLTLSFVAGQQQRDSTAAGNSYVDRRALVLLGYSANYDLRLLR